MPTPSHCEFRTLATNRQVISADHQRCNPSGHPKTMPAKRADKKTAVGRLVLSRRFLTTAAVCLDSAARRCGVLLRFCFRKTVPCFEHTANMDTYEQLRSSYGK